MGKCIKCGNETKNSYEYIATTIISRSGYQTITTKYGEFTSKRDFFCNKHAVKYIVYYLIAIALSISITIALYYNVDFSIVGVLIVCALVVTFCIILAVSTLIAMKKDKPINSLNKDLVAFLNKSRYKGDRAAYYTREQYNQFKGLLK